MRKTVLFIFLTLLSSTVFGQQKRPVSLEVAHLNGDFYIYTTYNYYKGNRIPANGLYLVSDSGVLIIDSPWDTTQFQPLLDTIQARHNKKAVICIATHFHEDRTGGLDYYRKKGIKTFTIRKTDELSLLKGMKRAEFLIEKDSTFTIGQYAFDIIYPGPGHAPDNIVVWFENQKVLYGGCLVKSVEDTNLGNLGDADVSAYAATIENVIRKCGKPQFVIPGHNSWTDRSSLQHTLKMAMELNKEIKQ